ncbi:MAG: cytochrome oxidase subunit III [Cyanothece sp. SIO1E1]|nr:cytochrome oxidase subunit III [Cyanothece sp. SIO1E1]
MATTDTVVEHEVHDDKELWSGAKEPFKASYGKLMMWYFLLSDAFTFAGFLIAYGALRFSSPTWPVPDFVFKTHPFGDSELPLIFVTVMSFLLIISSVTMVRGVQEGHRNNTKGVVFWMLLTILGGIGFLSCQAWEWTNLIATEHMTVTRNPFGTHVEAGVYLNDDGSESDEVFEAGASYLIHKAGHHGHGDDHGGGHGGDAGHGDEAHGDDHGGDHGDGHSADATAPGDYKGHVVDNQGFLHRKYKVTEGPDAGTVKYESFGPKSFGALFFFITGFHGFHVFSGVVFLFIIMINAASGLYVERNNGHEMVEKIGLYWHFVDLVWVFVFLVFYLL